MDRFRDMNQLIAMEANWLTRNNIKPTALDGTIPYVQDMIAEEAFTKAGKKYEQLAKVKSVTQIVSEVLNCLKKANVKIDTSVNAARWLAICAGSSAFALSSGKINGVPVLIGGTSSYMTNGFYFCVEKKNGKPRVIYLTNRAIANLYNDDLSAVEPERIDKYAKYLLKYVENHNGDNDSFSPNTKDAMEGIFGWGKKRNVKESPEQKAQLATLNELYGKQMLALAKEIGDDFDRRMHSNKAFNGNYTLEANDKNGSSAISKKGDVNIAVINWQAISHAIANLNNLDSLDDSDEIAERYSKMVDLDYYIRKYESRARAIHPSCQIKKLEDDIDLLYLHIDPNSATAE